MKHLKLFQTEAEYTVYKNGGDFITPNVSYAVDNKKISYNPKETEEPPIAPIGASIYGLDGKFYSASEWTAAGKSNSDVVGVAVSDGEHSFVIHPTENIDGLMWSSNTSKLVDGVFTTKDRATAETDFAGEANTAAMLAAVSAATIYNAPAASYCDGVEFAHGKKGYLPAAGEITMCYTYLTTINECMSAIGGTTFYMANKDYWTSTQAFTTISWFWNYSDEHILKTMKNSGRTVRAFSAL